MTSTPLLHASRSTRSEAMARNEKVCRIESDIEALLQGCVDLCDILRRIQDTLSRHVDPGGDLQDPMETVNALLDIADHKDTLAKQRAALAAIARAEGVTP